MANEMKACCGGFLVGEGLEMDGKVLKASGGAGGANFYHVEISGEVPSWAGGGEILFLSFAVATDAEFTNKDEFIDFLNEEGFLYMVSTSREGMFTDDEDNDYEILTSSFVNIGDSGMCARVVCLNSDDGSVHVKDLPLYPDTIEIDIAKR